MKIYLTLHTKPDNKILIKLRYSTANTQFNAGRTIEHLIEKDRLSVILIKILKMTEKQLKNTNDLKADIKFKGDSQFHLLIGDLFWDKMTDPSLIFKKNHSIITFVSKKINLTIINFDIVNYFRFF
jgi:hypothetical protein